MQPEPKITLVWRTDVHLSDYAPRSRKDDWVETISRKLREVGEIARDVGAHAVLDGGDFFHVKSPTRNSHALCRRVAEIHVGYPCPVYANIGNHDCKYGDIRFLDEQPLGVLFEAGVFRRLYDEHEIVFLDGDLSVRVVGVPYHGSHYDWSRFRRIRKGLEDYLVVVVHCLASPSGGSMFEGEDIIGYKDIPNLMPDASVIAFGHWHKNQGVTEIRPGKFVVNVGSLSRGALTQDEMSRVPVVAVLQFTKDGISIEERPITIQPPEDIFDIKGRVLAEEREDALIGFAKTFQDVFDRARETPLLDLIRNAEGVESEVREAAISYLEAVLPQK